MKIQSLVRQLGLFSTLFLGNAFAADQDGEVNVADAPPTVAANWKCALIDLSQKDSDGMPFCPAIVETDSAFSVFTCAINAARSFHVPTNAEKQLMKNLLTTFKKVKEDGISSNTTSTMLSYADKLNLQMCRVKQTFSDNGVKRPDSYLLVYTKPGVSDYSGPLLMLRETKSSNVIVVSPHDDSDGTYADTKMALANSQALAVISNGHKRGSVQVYRESDFVHSTNNLGTYAFATFTALFPSSVVLHIHGMADKTKVLYRARSKVLSKVFEDAVIASVPRIGAGDFQALNAGFTIDKLANTNYYVKTEMPAIVHQNNKTALGNIVRIIEKNAWAWGGAAPANDENNNNDDGDGDGIDEDLGND